MALIVFWLAAALVVYHHVGYPLVLRLWARRLGSGSNGAAGSMSPERPTWPSLTVIVPAHDEAVVIAEKITNLDALDYPRDRLTFVLALDGCTDSTEAIATAAIAGLSDPRPWQLVSRTPNQGKVRTLNEAIAHADGEIVVLTDASALVEPDALKRLATHFADPEVAVVSGTYRLARPGSAGEAAYWAYQTNLKMSETTVSGACLGAHGAFYGFRRSTWTPLPADTINDDFVLPMRIAAAGHRAIYDPSIVATELERSRPGQDFRRRIRIAAGNLQQLVRLPELFDPRRPRLAFVYLSGKALRAVMPLVLAALVAATAVLASHGAVFFKTLLVAEIAGITVSLAAVAFGPDRLPRPLAQVAYLVTGHVAGLVGCLLVLLRLERKAWRLSTRAKSAVAAPVSAQTTVRGEPLLADDR